MNQVPDELRRCPSCAIDWTSPAAYMQSWQPCRCSTVGSGHRIYVCMACRAKIYDTPHLAPVLAFARGPAAPGARPRGQGTKRSPSRRGFG